jgi:type IV secretory pathway TraG/TraD family ATPase VirD4
LAARAPLKRTIFFPVVGVPALIVGALLSSWMLPAGHPDSLFLNLLGFAVLLGTSALIGFIHGLPAADTVQYKRGTVMQNATPRGASDHHRAQMTLAGQPISELDETKHFKIIGTTGTGKSTAIREVLGKALKRGDRAIIADPDGSYLHQFFDPSRGDLILSPFDTRAASWDLFGEMDTLIDADHLAQSLIPDTEGTERSWRNYARIFLTAILRQLHRVKHQDVGELYRLLAVTPVADLQDLLADTPAGPYLSQDNGKFFAAVRAVANTYLGSLEHVASQSATHSLSVRQWVREGQGGSRGVLFLPYRANEIAALRGLLSTWMRLAIFETMSQPQQDQHLWFMIDELDALGPIDGLKDALARLRKFGGRCVLGLQSIAQVSGSYGHAEAQTIVENCGNTLILRCSASESGGTAHFASKLIGEREIIRETMSQTHTPGQWRSTKTYGKHHVTEPAVLTSEIEQLPDLQGYLKLASTPHWSRVKLGISPAGSQSNSREASLG